MIIIYLCFELKNKNKKQGKMPQQISSRTNGYTNGHGTSGLYEMEDQQVFLFTSESVGEGHPGM